MILKNDMPYFDDENSLREEIIQSKNDMLATFVLAIIAVIVGTILLVVDIKTPGTIAMVIGALIFSVSIVSWFDKRGFEKQLKALQ